MKPFVPDMVYIDPAILKFEYGKSFKEFLIKNNIPFEESKSVSIPGNSMLETYVKSKRTILATLNRQKKLAPCKPSADYQFSLSSSCPGNCEYCYLQTTQGEKPFIKLFINIEDILRVINSYIEDNKPNVTSFECASITDPVSLEHLTGNLKRCIEFFGETEFGRLRLVTKFDNVNSLLNINHNKHTKFRFSINTRYVIQSFEHNTSSFEERIEAAKKIAIAGYPIGFIIAPIMIYDNWERDYDELILRLSNALNGYNDEISFELIQHRFTSTAKELILSRFPHTKLNMNEDERLLKWGPYGKFKYVYQKEQSSYIKSYLSKLIEDNFNNSLIEYFT